MHKHNVCGNIEKMVGELIIQIDVKPGDFNIFIVENLIEGEYNPDYNCRDSLNISNITYIPMKL